MKLFLRLFKLAVSPRCDMFKISVKYPLLMSLQVNNGQNNKIIIRQYLCIVFIESVYFRTGRRQLITYFPANPKTLYYCVVIERWARKQEPSSQRDKRKSAFFRRFHPQRCSTEMIPEIPEISVVLETSFIRRTLRQTWTISTVLMRLIEVNLRQGQQCSDFQPMPSAPLSCATAYIMIYFTSTMLICKQRYHM